MRNPYYGCVLPGHVARHAEPHAEPRPPIRVRGRHHRSRGSLDHASSIRMHKLAITDLAQAAYARSPIPQVPVSDVQRAAAARCMPRSPIWARPGTASTMFMPRVSFAYKLGERTVLKGWVRPVLRHAERRRLQRGRTSSATRRRRQTWRARTSARPGSWAIRGTAFCRSSNPFPVAPTEPGSSRRSRIRSVPTPFSGSGFNRENPNRKHARVNRWRVGVQRELFGNMSVEVAYSGMYSDRVDRTIQESYIPGVVLQHQRHQPRQRRRRRCCSSR